MGNSGHTGDRAFALYITRIWKKIGKKTVPTAIYRQLSAGFTGLLLMTDGRPVLVLMDSPAPIRNGLSRKDATSREPAGGVPIL